jgi:hypothetical protein
MDAFEIVIKEDVFKITRNKPENYFNVFNHTTFHIIRKNDFGVWQSLQHRFGKEIIPIQEIGAEIDRYYAPLGHGAANFG